MTTSTFMFYTDSGLTTPYTGTTALINKTDFSDNPQSFLLYFGSATSGRKLQTQTSPGSNQVILTPTDIASKWAVATAYTVGNIIEPTTANGYIYICTTAGTSNATTEPTWPTTVSNTVTDGSTAIWTCYAPRHSVNEIRLALAGGSTLTAATPGAALNLGATIYSGSSNAVAVYFSVTNGCAVVNTNVGYPTIGININACQETSA